MTGRDYRTYPTAGVNNRCPYCPVRHKSKEVAARCQDRAEAGWDDLEDDVRWVGQWEVELREFSLLRALEGMSLLEDLGRDVRFRAHHWEEPVIAHERK